MDDKKKIVQSAVSIVILLLVAVVLISIYFSSKSWFTFTRYVKSNDVSVNVIDYNVWAEFTILKSDNSTEYPLDNGMFVVSDFNLGDSYNIKVVFTNNETIPISANLSFLAPDNNNNGYETPYVLENNYYYLSTQLKVTDITCENAAIVKTKGKDKFITEVPGDGNYTDGLPNFTGVTQEINLGELDIADITLPPESSSSVTIEVTYVKSNVNQNIFKIFNSQDHINFSRRLFCTYQSN